MKCTVVRGSHPTSARCDSVTPPCIWPCSRAVGQAVRARGAAGAWRDGGRSGAHHPKPIQRAVLSPTAAGIESPAGASPWRLAQGDQARLWVGGWSRARAALEGAWPPSGVETGAHARHRPPPCATQTHPPGGSEVAWRAAGGVPSVARVADCPLPSCLDILLDICLK